MSKCKVVVYWLIVVLNASAFRLQCFQKAELRYTASYLQNRRRYTQSLNMRGTLIDANKQVKSPKILVYI